MLGSPSIFLPLYLGHGTWTVLLCAVVFAFVCTLTLGYNRTRISYNYIVCAILCMDEWVYGAA